MVRTEPEPDEVLGFTTNVVLLQQSLLIHWEKKKHFLEKGFNPTLGHLMIIFSLHSVKLFTASLSGSIWTISAIFLKINFALKF